MNILEIALSRHQERRFALCVAIAPCMFTGDTALFPDDMVKQADALLIAIEKEELRELKRLSKEFKL